MIRTTIKLTEIPEPYRTQVRRFLHLYPKRQGQRIASRYLQVVSSAEYRKSSGRQVHKKVESSEFGINRAAISNQRSKNET